MLNRQSRRLMALAGVSITALILSGCTSGSSSSSSGTIPKISKDEALAALVPAAYSANGTIRVGTDASYAPNEYIDGEQIVGMDIDLGNAIGEVLGVTMKFTNSPFDAIIPGIQSGKYDLGMSSFTANAERQKVVNFATYFSAGTQWATRAGNPDAIAINNACGKKIAVQKGTVQVDDLTARSKKCTTAGKKAITINQYQLQSDATNAVASGKDQAMLADSPITAYAVKTAPGLELLGDIYDSAPYGIALPCGSAGSKSCATPLSAQPKANADFAKAVQGAIKKLIEGGQYKAILTKWGVDGGAVTSSTINPAK